MTTFRTIVLLGLLATVSGCGADYLDESYGRHRQLGAAGSVNGTDVLAAAFEDAGHEVHFRRTLITSQMQAANTVVWFPDDTYAPTQELCDWFDEWLATEPNRTLIFVGRDFNAAPQYWDFHFRRQPSSGETDRAKSKSPEDAEKTQDSQDQLEDESKPAKKHKRESSNDEDEQLSESCAWFSYEADGKTEVQELTGPWAEGMDAGGARIEVRTRLVPHGPFKTLLGSNAGPLVTRITQPYWDDGQIILVENGSFLLNLTLINHEHRKLAGELVAAAGPGENVVFLESRKGGPPIDPPPADSSLWTLFEGWPLGAILFQLAAAGTIFCFARWPIFGRPKQPAPPTTTDFTAHIAAVGRLLAKLRDRPQDQQPPPVPAVPLQVPRRTKNSMFR